MHLENARIEKNIAISQGIYSMDLSAPSIAKEARAGQFVMFFLDSPEMLLPRPISLCDANAIAGTINIVYQVVGAGTKRMSEMKEGRVVQLTGPLGNGFLAKGKDNKRFSRVALVGGGMGSPPLYFLAKTLATRGTYADIFLGFRSEPILLERFETVADRLVIATEEGSYWHRGRITEFLHTQGRGYDEIMACGPMPLLRALAEYSKEENISCQVCIEERMACGIGTCVGCVVKAGDTYVRVCCEGPVFYSDEVNLNEKFNC